MNKQLFKKRESAQGPAACSITKRDAGTRLEFPSILPLTWNWPSSLHKAPASALHKSSQIYSISPKMGTEVSPENVLFSNPSWGRHQGSNSAQCINSGVPWRALSNSFSLSPPSPSTIPSWFLPKIPPLNIYSLLFRSQASSRLAFPKHALSHASPGVLCNTQVPPGLCPRD